MAVTQQYAILKLSRRNKIYVEVRNKGNHNRIMRHNTLQGAKNAVCLLKQLYPDDNFIYVKQKSFCIICNRLVVIKNFMDYCDRCDKKLRKEFQNNSLLH